MENINRLPKITRLELIDDNGRVYTNYAVENIELHLQDNQQTLKIFFNNKSK